MNSIRGIYNIINSKHFKDIPLWKRYFLGIPAAVKGAYLYSKYKRYRKYKLSTYVSYFIVEAFEPGAADRILDRKN
jgi:hypothetical protein